MIMCVCSISLQAPRPHRVCGYVYTQEQGQVQAILINCLLLTFSHSQNMLYCTIYLLVNSLIYCVYNVKM